MILNNRKKNLKPLLSLMILIGACQLNPLLNLLSLLHIPLLLARFGQKGRLLKKKRKEKDRNEKYTDYKVNPFYWLGRSTTRYKKKWPRQIIEITKS